jgi:TetR/AcrR family transcriptional regulator
LSRVPSKSERSAKTAPAAIPSATRSKILSAATQLFAANGSQGTTIRQIAAAAGVNSQLIYYYFHDKEGLFRAVLEGAAGRVDSLLAQAAQANGPPRERLALFISEWVKVTLAEAPAIRMLHRAMLEGDEALAGDIQQYAGAHAAQIGSLIREGVAAGAFRVDLDPRRAVVSLVSMVQYLALAEPFLFTSTKLRQNREERAAMAQHTAELFLQGLDAAR